MNKIILILMISISLIGYGEEVNKKQLEYRNGVFYEINQPIPYTGKKFVYYKSGQIQIKAKFKSGKIEDIISYNKSGSIRVNSYGSNPILRKVKFTDEKIKGKSIFYYETGQVDYEINVEDGKIVYLFR